MLSLQLTVGTDDDDITFNADDINPFAAVLMSFLVMR